MNTGCSVTVLTVVDYYSHGRYSTAIWMGTDFTPNANDHSPNNESTAEPYECTVSWSWKYDGRACWNG